MTKENCEDWRSDVLPSIAVLLSTYNGSKYLTELLDSVLSQRGVSVRLYARDDGSSDDTPRILSEYEESHANMTVHLGSNIGVIASFNELISISEISLFDYVAFCDQDDVWLADKLITAVNKLDATKEHNLPVMYCSNLTVVDERLNVLRSMRREEILLTKESVLVQNVGTGCTEVFNQKAREMYQLGIGSAMEMHDYWMTLVCMFIGRIIYDDESHILYRQHETNVVGARKRSVRTAIANLIKSKRSYRIQMLKDFIKIYDNLLSTEDRLTITMLTKSDNSIVTRLKLILSRKYIGYDPRVTAGFKIRTAIGRLY